MRVLLLLSVSVLLSACAARVTKSRPVTETLHGIHEPLPRDLRAADAAAQERLMNLHFFAEGRGMHLAPGFIRQYHATAWTGLPTLLVRDRWGFNVVDGRVAGLFDVGYKDMRIGVAGCAACHSGKAAGRFYPGLGNKTIDVAQLGRDLSWMQRIFAWIALSSGERREVEQSAVGFAEALGNPKTGNLTQGMVSDSVVYDWFYRQEKGSGTPHTRGAVKVPAFWGYAAKRAAGLFCDGYINGPMPVVLVELTAGQKAETVRRYLPAVERAQEIFAALLPAPYPFAVDRRLAARGAQVFSLNCRECHGTYSRDAEGLPLWKPPKWFALEEVGTDSDRLDLTTTQFLEVAIRNPLDDLITIDPSRRRGYFAPRLEGIWARFPYLHNGSVPNLSALLTQPEERPHVFSLKRAGEQERFDETMLGLTLPDARERRRLLERGAKGDRSVYDTRRVGHSPQGHDFGTRLPEEDKRALIEFLKTL